MVRIMIMTNIQTGLLKNRNYSDEKFLLEIGSLSPNQDGPNNLHIYDARSYINALANRVTSGGFENTQDHYKGSELIFCDIDNIHAVREALNKVYDLGQSVNP